MSTHVPNVFWSKKGDGLKASSVAYQGEGILGF